MQVFFRNENRDHILAPLSSTAGGEGYLCKIVGDPHRCAKVFTPPVRNDLEARLEYLVRGKRTLPGSNVAWPHDIIEDGTSHVIGYVQEFFGPSFVPASQLVNQLVRPAWANERAILSAAYEMANTVAELHDQGFLFPDLHDEQFLASPSQAPVLIDTASVQFFDGSHLFPCDKVRREYQAPELVMATDWSTVAPRRDVYSDAWSLNILLFRLLMSCHPFDALHVGTGTLLTLEQRIAQGHFPFDKRCQDYRPPRHAPIYRSLAPELRDMFQRCFVDGHALGDRSSRPLPAECADILRYCPGIWVGTQPPGPRPPIQVAASTAKWVPWVTAIAAGSLFGVGLAQMSESFKVARREYRREAKDFVPWFDASVRLEDEDAIQRLVHRLRSE